MCAHPWWCVCVCVQACLYLCVNLYVPLQERLPLPRPYHLFKWKSYTGRHTGERKYRWSKKLAIFSLVLFILLLLPIIIIIIRLYTTSYGNQPHQTPPDTPKIIDVANLSSWHQHGLKQGHQGWVRLGGRGAWLISQSLRGRRGTTGGLPLFGRRLAPVFSCRRWREMHAGALLLFALSNRSARSSVRVLFWSSGLIVEPGGEHRVSNFFQDNHTRRSEKNKLESLGTDQLHFLSLSREGKLS